MPRIDAAYLAHQRKRWMRPNAHLFIRPDWRRFVRPGERDGHPFALYERKYRPDQPREAGYPQKKIDAPENLVSIPRMRHWEINAWYQTRNSDYGDLSPREYLSGKDWDERRKVGLDALVKSGVLKR